MGWLMQGIEESDASVMREMDEYELAWWSTRVYLSLMRAGLKPLLLETWQIIRPCHFLLMRACPFDTRVRVTITSFDHWTSAFCSTST